MNLLENFMLAHCFSHCDTSGMVAGSIPDGVIGLFFIDTNLPAALWSWG